ncbi:hypothetical protein [Mangrovibacterium sp.]
MARFRQWGSSTPDHPAVDFVRSIENACDPMGQGIRWLCRAIADKI